MSSFAKLSNNIGFIASIIGIAAFFGYPTIKSFFDTSTPISNVNNQKNTSIDYLLVGSWKYQPKDDEKDIEATYKFENNGTGLLSFNLKRSDDEYESKTVCPFRWKTAKSNSIMDTIEISYGICEIIYCKYKAPYGILYKTQQEWNDILYNKKIETLPYIWQNNSIYFERIRNSSNGKIVGRERFLKVE